MQYRKKPVVIEAIQLIKDHERIATCIEWVEGIDMSTSVIGRNACVSQVFIEDGLVIKTLEGEMKASFGDYIIKGVEGEFYPCKPDIFEQTYELADKEVIETAKAVVDTINKMQRQTLARSSALNN